MSELIGRQYCLQNPGAIIRYFGLGVFIGMLFGGQKSLLERAITAYERRGVQMPGPLGNSYKLAARIEFRMARLYKKMAQRFSDNTVLSSFFSDLREEEVEHGRLMLLCLYCVKLNPESNFIPAVRDAEIREILRDIKTCEKRVESLSPEEALRITEEFEKSEVNTIFGKLLGQAMHHEVGLFAEKLEEVESHSITVPRRIREIMNNLDLV